jgi:hypothetical protein
MTPIPLKPKLVVLLDNGTPVVFCSNIEDMAVTVTNSFDQYRELTKTLPYETERFESPSE